MRTLSLQIDETLAGRRVKSLLQYRLHIPVGMIARIKLRPAGICLNGQRCRTVDQVKAGDILRVEVGDIPEESGITPMEYPLSILYEDEDLLVVDKPAFMATHGKAQKGDITLANALAAYWGTDRAFHPVNRLDRGTSGLMAVAKSGFAHERLRNILHTEDFCREYLAIVVGTFEQTESSITLPMKKDDSAKNKFCVSPDGMDARTDYKVLCRSATHSLVHARLWTGRTHQIRVHLAAIGHPLLGDRVYGSASERIDRPALHSFSLRLRQPITGEQISLTSPLPADMLSAAGYCGFAPEELYGNL